MAFNSGVALGSNRVSIFRHSWAQARAALCWEARSSKSTRFQPRQWARINLRNASCESWVQSSVINNARSPLRILIAPWRTRLLWVPLIGTRTCSPMGLRTDSASLRFFRQRIASFLSPRTDSASLRLVAEAIAVRDTRALVRSRSSVACVRAGDYAGNLTNWRENTRCAARPPASGATRPRRSRPAMQAGTATSRRRRCRLRPTFKGVMRCRMESPSDEAMRCRFALADGTIAGIQRRRLRDNRFVQHQQHGARAILEAAF